MPSFLKPHVHPARIEGDLVLLDVAGDAYLCLAGAAGSVRRTPKGYAVTDPHVAGALFDAGLTSTTPAPRAAPPPALPVRTVIHQAGEPLGARDVWAALGAAADVRSIRPGAGVQAYLETAVEGSRTPVEVAAGAARRFWRISPWLPVEGECLLRSALLIAYLRRLGLRADWVFGVRLWPFMAHCWVQLDDLCLNDDVERLSAYTPILRR